MCISKPKRRNEEGSTYVELLVALALMSLFSLGVYRYILFTVRTGSLLHENITANLAVFQAERVLKTECSRVVFPYWSPPDPYIYLNETDVRVPYFGGVKGSQLRILVEGSVLTVKTEETIMPLVFPGCNLKLSGLEEHGSRIGIVLTVSREKTGEEIAVISCPFGGVPTL